ncbi:hypothetical protein RUM43_002103 [Polyplax serrata]|uniref:SH2 domain-containing protein n=1 Tax=Polyplax serrata TaxID=468196 RepID=A0AAN8NYT2_POLSC
MLQQILRDLYIDPELLAELGEDQKQTLFCRMREEQVRRWRIWDNEQQELEKLNGGKPERKPKVKFLEGSDGEPWTWVMGEHPDDKSIEQILEEEAREKARKLAEKEAKEFRKSVEAGLNEILDLNQKQIQKTVEAELNEILDMNQKQIEQLEAAKTLNRLKEKTITIIPDHEEDDSDIYCTVDELRRKLRTTTPFEVQKYNGNPKMNVNSVPQYRNKVAATVAQWEKRVMEERTSQIFNRLQKKQLEAAKEAEDADKRQEILWRAQEKKAKEAEQQIREIARRAREEHKRTSCCEVPEVPIENGTSQQVKRITKEPASMSVGVIKPRSREAITEWFQTVEVERRAAAIDDKNQAAPWFHGLISRQEAENLLSDKPVGSFLVRISEKICGYAISYKDLDRCKHYLIDASNGHYQFLGANQIPHKTLGDLISFHETQAITALGGELLRTPCRPAYIPDVFRGLSIYAAR